jgi:hypothetical protein
MVVKVGDEASELHNLEDVKNSVATTEVLGICTSENKKVRVVTTRTDGKLEFLCRSYLAPGCATLRKEHLLL